MNKLFKKFEKNLKKMGLWDIAFVKWSSFLIGTIVGAYVAGFVKTYVVIIAVVAILLIIRPTMKFLK